jgi:putative phosphoribosyl transferase
MMAPALRPEFADRNEAGVVLGAKLAHHRGDPDVVVLGLPRGGVPVAARVAETLGAPLDVFLVRKLGVPGREELAMGAIASGGVRVMNDDVVAGLGIPDHVVEAVAAVEAAELERREATYRGRRPPVPLAARLVVVVDDGMATGSSMRAAVAALRRHAPAAIVAAVPAAPAASCAQLASEVDEVVCAVTPEPFRAVGLAYGDFEQTTDEEVCTLLEEATARSRQ